MKITSKKSTIKTIRSNDKGFMISDGIIISPRAGFEINEHCPSEYRQIIDACIDRGWLLPVAHVKEQEYIWEVLCD